MKHRGIRKKHIISSPEEVAGQANRIKESSANINPELLRATAQKIEEAAMREVRT